MALENVSSTPSQTIVEPALAPAPVWRIVLACGASAAVLAGLFGEFAYAVIKPELVKTTVLLQTFMEVTVETDKAATVRNIIVSAAIFGGALGLAMGLAGGLAARSTTRGVIVGLIAAAITALSGAAVARALLPLFFRRLVPDPNDLMTPILVHGGIWATLGAASAVAFAIGFKASWRECIYIVVNASVAAFSASFLYHMAAEGIYSSSDAIAPIPAAPTARLLAAAFVTLLTAIGVASGVAAGSRSPAGANA
jgi:hypothetical protein